MVAKQCLPVFFAQLFIIVVVFAKSINDAEKTDEDTFDDTKFILDDDPDYVAPSDIVCPECKADDEGGVDAGFDDATPNICAVQYQQPNEVNNFTVCQLLRHNCQQPNNAFAQILSTECPPPYMQLPCDEQTVCSPNSALTADTPVCGETFVTKLKQRFDNECAMHRANCLYPMNAYTIIPCTDNEVNQINDPLTI